MEQATTQTGKGRSKALWATVAIIGIAAAGAVGAKTIYQTKITEMVARSGATARSIEVDFLGNIHLRELTLPLRDGNNMRIASIDGRPKLPLLEGALDLKDIDIEGPTGKISIPDARIENAALAKPTTEPGEANGKSLSQRIKGFSAKRISTPEIISTQSISTTEQKTTYKDVAFLDIADGIIARYSLGTGHYDIKMTLPDSPERHVLVSTGPITGQDFDLAYIARIYTEKAGPDDKEPKSLYGPLSVKNISFTQGDSQFGYDEIRSDGFTARMPSEPLLDTLKTLRATEDINELPAQDRKALAAKAFSLVDMIGKGNIQFLGLKAEGLDTSDGADGKRIKVAVNRLDMQIDNRKLDFDLNGMSFGSDSDKIEVAEVSLKGFDWGSTLDGAAELIGLDETQIASFPFYRLVPELGKVRVGGINVDVAAPEKAEEGTTDVPERVKFSLKNFEMGLTKPFKGIPTDIEIRQDELTFPIPEDSTEQALIEVRKLGLQSFTISYALSAGWDQANNNLLIRQIALSGKDFGSIDISGVISGFTEEFFAFDLGRAQAAVFGLAGREMNVSIKDEGMVDKAVKLYAIQNDMNEDQVRGMMTMVANMLLPQFATEHPKLKSAIDALLSFIGTPGTITVAVKSNGPNGLGLLDLVAASNDPMLLLDKVDIQAAAK